MGIALKWDYEKLTVQLSMLGYVHAVLHSLKHKNKKTPELTMTLDTNNISKIQSDTIRKSSS